MNVRATAATLALLVLLVGCRERRFDHPLRLGGREVQPEVLERGWQVYRRMCVGCHGERGDGNGDAGQDTSPRPRDFRMGQFKFASVPAGELPTDEDLRQTVRKGLAGTNMAAMTSLGDDDVDAVIQYIKTFSPRWRAGTPGTPTPTPPDPWVGREGAAVERGRVVYHGTGRCWTCHPAYASRDEILSLAPREGGIVETIRSHDIAFRGDITRSRAVESAFGKVLPPDFLGDTVRAGNSVQMLFRSISAGIGGSAMPGESETISSEDLWAVAHYVGQLVRAKGTPDAALIRHRATRAYDTSPHGPAHELAPEPARPAKNNKG